LPRYADDAPINLFVFGEEVFVDWQRARDHACLFYEYGLLNHVRCRLCGKVVERP